MLYRNFEESLKNRKVIENSRNSSFSMTFVLYQRPLRGLPESKMSIRKPECHRKPDKFIKIYDIRAGTKGKMNINAPERHRKPVKLVVFYDIRASRRLKMRITGFESSKPLLCIISHSSRNHPTTSSEIMLYVLFQERCIVSELIE